MPGCEPKELLLWSIFTRVWGQDKYEFGRLAQWLERLLHTQEVTGSNPVPPTIDARRSRLDLLLVKQEAGDEA